MKLTISLPMLSALLLSTPVLLAEENAAPTAGSAENNWGMRQDTDYIWGIDGDVVWQEAPAETKHLNIGDYAGEASLTVADGTQVDMYGSVFIGGTGYFQGEDDPKPEGYDHTQNNDGTLTIGKNASFTVGAGVSHPSAAHLDIGWGRGSCTGTVHVNGGTLQSDSTIYLGEGYGSTGILNVTDHGSVLIDGSRMSPYSAQRPVVAELYVGQESGSQGIINLSEGSSLTFRGSDNGMCLFYMAADPAGVDSGTSESHAASHGEINLSGKSSALFSDTQNYVGYWGEALIRVTEGSSLTFERTDQAYSTACGNVHVGYAAGSTARIEVDGRSEDGTVSTLAISGETNIGYNGGKGVVAISNGAEASFGGGVAVGAWNASEGELSISGGASALVFGELNVAHDATSSGIVKVEGEGSVLTVNAATRLGYGGNTGQLVVTNGASARLQDGIEGLSVGRQSSVTVADGKTTASSMVVGGILQNRGSITANLNHGGFFSSVILMNMGTVDADLAGGASFSVGRYVNIGDSTFTVASGSSCHFNILYLAAGTLTFDGQASYQLGGETGTHTIFSVSGTESTTCINVTPMGSGDGAAVFTLAPASSFELNFADADLATLAVGSARHYELRLVLGYEGYEMTAEERADLLSRTTYSYAAEGKQFAVSDAQYIMVGDDLVWTGTVTVVPEPATATLSLLALTALAARRRR